MRQAEPGGGEEADEKARQLKLLRLVPVPSDARADVAPSHSWDHVLLGVAVGIHVSHRRGLIQYILRARSSEAAHRVRRVSSMKSAAHRF